ncbi:MAG: HAD hydrolase family protein, partial [Betaproteobacteria bacterium]
GVDLDAERDRFIFIGDSPNDAAMFEYFPYAVGVANVRKFAGRLANLPVFVTERESGAGFAELVDYLLAAR